MVMYGIAQNQPILYITVIYHTIPAYPSHPVSLGPCRACGFVTNVFIGCHLRYSLFNASWPGVTGQLEGMNPLKFRSPPHPLLVTNIAIEHYDEYNGFSREKW